MKRWWLPIMIAASGVALLVGCFPVTRDTLDPHSPRQAISAWTIWGLHVGRDTRPDVILKLGTPVEDERRADGSHVVSYRWDMFRQSGFATLCGFQSLDDPSDYYKALRLEFGPDDRLKSKILEDSSIKKANGPQ